MKGYISEIFSSFQGEGGSVIGSCQGKRQIFVRFSGCNLFESGTQCVWCDSGRALELKSENFRAEIEPGKKEFKEYKNPIEVERLLEIVDDLKTPDLHSIAITGGEPLLQIRFLESLILEADERIYLETNGSLPKAAKRIAEHVDFACVDIKDESAIPYKGWREIVDREMETIGILKDGGGSVFAKVVVTDDTTIENISLYARRLRDIGVPLAIQPAVFNRSEEGIGNEKLFRLSEAAAQYLSGDEITLSLQTHRLRDIL